MLNASQLRTLATHVAQISLYLLKQIGSDGVVRSFDSGGEVSADLAVSHDLLELLSIIDSVTFTHEIKTIADWMLDPSNHSREHYLSLHVLGLTAPKTPTTEGYLLAQIAASQRTDGALPEFETRDPGSIFASTLCCVRILTSYSSKAFQKETSSALRYLLMNANSADMGVAQRSELCVLLARYDPALYRQKCSPILNGILQKTTDSYAERLTPSMLLEYCRVMRNLLEIQLIDASATSLDICDNFTRLLFDLDRPATALPPILAQTHSHSSESVFFQTLCWSCMVGALMCRVLGYTNLANDIRALVLDQSTIHYRSILSDVSVKRWIERYQPIPKNYRPFSHILERIWVNDPFEKLVFLIVPTGRDHHVAARTEAIKKACTKLGYHAITPGDADRQFAGERRDNVLINMLACQSAILIHAENTTHGVTGEGILFHDNDVTLEYLFYQTQGRSVLLLRDQNTPLSPDLEALPWCGIDANRPDETILEQISLWLKEK